MPSPEKFKKSLEMFDVDDAIISQINEGYEDIVDKSPKKTKAAYFKRAVDIRTEQIDAQELQDIFDYYYYEDEPVLTLLLIKPDKREVTLELEKEEGEE